MSRFSSAQIRIYAREFVIYGLCGFGSLFIFIGVYFLCEKIAPGHVSESLPDSVRARNLIDFKIIAFFPSNIFSWWSNRTLVFRSTKHSLRKELFIFFSIAAASAVLGEIAPYFLIRSFSVSNEIAMATFAFLSALWNFILRRLFVFGGETARA